VVLHSIEEDRGTRFLTMELVDGASVDQSITPRGLAADRVIELGIAIADALAAAHEKGVVHRDLKPANVMLTRDVRPYPSASGAQPPSASLQYSIRGGARS
jgi:serine/threonine protein kinase